MSNIYILRLFLQKVAIISEYLIVVESRLLALHATVTNGKQKCSAKTNCIGNKAESS